MRSIIYCMYVHVCIYSTIYYTCNMKVFGMSVHTHAPDSCTQMKIYSVRVLVVRTTRNMSHFHLAVGPDIEKDTHTHSRTQQTHTHTHTRLQETKPSVESVGERGGGREEDEEGVEELCTTQKKGHSLLY